MTLAISESKSEEITVFVVTPESSRVCGPNAGSKSAMRPGEGKTHMVCANVCIMGGVPPMLVIYDEKGVSDILMLADENGKSLAGRVSDYTSLFVSIAGQVEQRGDLKVFRIARNSLSVI